METADTWGSASTHGTGEELTWEQSLLSQVARGAGQLLFALGRDSTSQDRLRDQEAPHEGIVGAGGWLNRPFPRLPGSSVCSRARAQPCHSMADEGPSLPPKLEFFKKWSPVNHLAPEHCLPHVGRKDSNLSL